MAISRNCALTIRAEIGRVKLIPLIYTLATGTKTEWIERCFQVKKDRHWLYIFSYIPTPCIESETGLILKRPIDTRRTIILVSSTTLIPLWPSQGYPSRFLQTSIVTHSRQSPKGPLFSLTEPRNFVDVFPQSLKRGRKSPSNPAANTPFKKSYITTLLFLMEEWYPPTMFHLQA